MTENIATQLYREFYHKNAGAADSAQSSAHWKEFSKQFKVDFKPDENIQTIHGYGFGGSGDKRLSAKIIAGIGNRLLLSRLHYPGLSAEVVQARKLVSSMGLSFSQDAFRQVCTKYLLKNFADKNSITLKNILIIGDGHGILAALLAEQYPDARIFLIDLGATLFFQAYYLGKTFKDKPHTLFGNTIQPDVDKGFFYCPAERLSDFPVQELDLAINVVSMQEMTMDTVRNYFSMLRERKTNLFYCCNRLEKKLPDGEITRFFVYPWKPADQHLIDEECPWHQFFVGRAVSENIKLFNRIPIPLLHRFEGVHWHRLTLLSH